MEKYRLLFLINVLLCVFSYNVSVGQCPTPTSSGSQAVSGGIKLSATSTNSSVTSHTWYTSPTGAGTVSPQLQQSYNTGTWTSEFTNTFSSTTSYYVASNCGASQSTGRLQVTATVSGGGGGTTNPPPVPTIGYNGTPCNGKELLFYFNTNGNATCTTPTWSYSVGGVPTYVPGNPNQIKITWPESSYYGFVSVSAFSTCNGVYKEYRYPSDGTNLRLDISRSPTVSVAATTNPPIMCEEIGGAVNFSNTAYGLPFNFNAGYNFYIDDVFVGSAPSSNQVSLFTYYTSANTVPLPAGVHTAKTVMSFSDLPCVIGPYNSVNTSSFNVISKENYTVSITGPNVIDNYNVPRRYTANVTTKIGPTGSLQYEWYVDDELVLPKSSANAAVDLLVSYGSTVLCKLYSDNVCEVAAANSNKIIISYPANNYNWIKETTVLEKDVVTDEGVNALTISDGKKQVNWTYFDGLGRGNQAIIVQGSPSKKDIVQPMVYDQYGRKSSKYLPYTSYGDGVFKTDFVAKENTSYNTMTSPQYQFYQNGLNVMPDSKPYSETVFEPSPLNRVLKRGAFGTAWQPNTDIYSMTDRTLKNRYEFSAANEIILFNYEPSTGMIGVSKVATEKYYGSNQLYVNKTYDEKNYQVIEYTDNEGKIICKKVQSSKPEEALAFASTYYLYDDFDNLVVVLPPEGVEKLKTALNLN